MSERALKQSDIKKYFEVLGVPKTASRVDLKKTAIRNHPGGGGGSCRGRRKRRGEDFIYPIRVTLDDLYNGTTKKLFFYFNVLCSKCKGKGSKSGASLNCKTCQGSGMKVIKTQLTSTYSQESLDSCDECKGTGESDKDLCPQCKGDKVIQENKVFEVFVEKGMQNGQKITFPGASNEAPDIVTGDIVFVLQQKEHPKFKRKGDDLFYEHTLSSTEALCGFQFALTHLDNRQMLIKSEPGEVIKPDQVKEINDEGMPMYQRPMIKGKLYIHFTVDSPSCAKKRERIAPRNGVAQEHGLYQDKIPLKAPKLLASSRRGHFKHVMPGLPVYIPFEFACGYALFRAHGLDDEVGENFESTEEYIKLYNEVFTLVAFHRFESSCDALFEMKSVSQNFVTEQMKSLLVNNLEKPDLEDRKYCIASFEPSIVVATKMPIRCSAKTFGVLRGLRLNICEFINDLQPAELEKAQRDLALNYSRHMLLQKQNRKEWLKHTYHGNSVAAVSSSSSYNGDAVVVPHRIEGVFIAMRENEDVICTKNLVPGEVVYGEELIPIKDENGVETEYRVWDPLKSKLAAAILSGVNNIWVKPGSRVLCMGDVCGATVSHLSDIVGPNGLVYAIDESVVALNMAEKRLNVIPIYGTIMGLVTYRMLLSMVDVICADAHHLEKVERLHLHCVHYLKTDGHYLVTTQANGVLSSSQGEPSLKCIHRPRREEHKIVELVKLKQIEEEIIFMAVGEFRTQLNGRGEAKLADGWLKKRTKPYKYIEILKLLQKEDEEDRREKSDLGWQLFLNQDYHS